MAEGGSNGGDFNDAGGVNGKRKVCYDDKANEDDNRGVKNNGIYAIKICNTISKPAGHAVP